MPNHFHLLVRTGRQSISKSMRRLLTGYVVNFNLRHKMYGHLFQNRYKSIICEDDPYLLELTRYIHLNPLRAEIVEDLGGLNRSRWTGHSAIMGRVKRDWQEIESILGYFGKGHWAVEKYEQYVREGVPHGKRPELVGGGLIRSLGGWSQVLSLRRKGIKIATDERILGGDKFIQWLLKETAERERVTLHLSCRGVVAADQPTQLPAPAISVYGAVLHKGRQQLVMQIRMRLERRGGWRVAVGHLPVAPAAGFTLTVPAAGTEVRLTGLADRSEYETAADNQQIATALNADGTLNLQWRPKVAEGQVDRSLTVTSEAVLDVQEDGLRLVWQLNLEFPRSRRDRFEVLIPAGYLVEKVLGDNVRAWDLKPADKLQRLSVSRADLILVRDSLDDLPHTVELARRTQRVIRQNLSWAVTYNLAALPLAALGFVPPWLAAIGMSLSSVVVVLNAMRLSRGSAPNRRPEWPATREAEAA